MVPACCVSLPPVASGSQYLHCPLYLLRLSHEVRLGAHRVTGRGFRTHIFSLLLFWCQELNSGPRACHAGAVPLS